MSDLTTSLILTGDARGLIAATQRGEAGLDGLRGSLRQTETGMKSAEASAGVFTSELASQKARVDQLRAGLDPLYAATRRMEAGQETLSRALALGSITAREYDSTLELLQRQHAQVAGAVDLQTTATARLSTVTRGGAGGMQNFSYQLQDIFTQVGMGVPLMISLGQQAPQILSGFGAVGAIAGVAAAAILPLTAVIFGLGYASKETAEDVKTSGEMIEQALSSISTAQTTLKNNSLADLDAMREKWGEITVSLLEFQKAQNDVVLQRAMRDARAGVESTFSSGEFAEFDGKVADFEARERELNRILEEAMSQGSSHVSRIQQELAELDFAGSIGISEDMFQSLEVYRAAIKETMDADNFDGALDAVIKIRESLASVPKDVLPDMFAGVVGLEGALREVLRTAEIHEEIQERTEGVVRDLSTIDVASNIAAGADQASRMADELSRAVSSAIALANQGVGAMDRARINYEFRDDPIGGAAALANAEFDSRTKMESFGPQTEDTTRILNRERDEFVNARVEAARYTQSLQDWRKEQAEAARTANSGSRSGGGGGRRGRRSEEERLIDDIAKQMDRLAPSYQRDLKELEEWRANALSILNPARVGYEAFADDIDFIFTERLAESYRKDLQERDNWAAGIERAFLDINKDMMTFADVGEDLTKKWTSGLEDAFVEMGRTGKFEVGSLIDYTLEQFQRLAFQQAIQPGLDAGFGLISDFIGGLIPGASGGSASLTQSHAGSTIGSGGVRRSYGGGSPLRADERLTVTTLGQRVFTPEQIGNGATVVNALASAAAANTGSGGVVFAPNISVQNNSSTPVQGEMEEQNDGQGGRSYKLILADQVGAAMNQPGGGAQKTLRRGGLKPKRAQR